MKRLLSFTVSACLALALFGKQPVLAKPPAIAAPAGSLAPAAGSVNVPQWYGWEILVLDGASIAIFEAGDQGHSTEPLVLGALSYFALGPLVHGGNGRSDRVVSSLLLRLGAPVVGVAAAGAVARACWRNDPSAIVPNVGQPPPPKVWTCSIGSYTAIYSALFVPIVAVSLFDAIRAFRFPQQPIASPPVSTARFEWLPTIAPTVVGAGATVGLVGAF